MAADQKLFVREVYASGYRSLRAIRFPVNRLTVFVGPNGAGKTNLYRALQLLQAAAAGNLGETLAAEGGMAAAMWAGARNAKRPVQIRLAVEFADTSDPETTLYSYEAIAGFQKGRGDLDRGSDAVRLVSGGRRRLTCAGSSQRPVKKRNRR